MPTFGGIGFGGGGSGLAWAVISSPAATGNYTDGNGVEWNYYTFTSSGTLTVSTAGFADILVVGGGGGGARSLSSYMGGGGGGVRYGIFELPATSLTVTVGPGGASLSNTSNANPVAGATGGESSVGSILIVGGGQGGYGSQSSSTNVNVPGTGGGGSAGGTRNNGTVGNANGAGAGGTVTGAAEIDGISLSYTGSAVEYGEGGNSGVGSAAGAGGWSPTNGVDGIVIVRVQI